MDSFWDEKGIILMRMIFLTWAKGVKEQVLTSVIQEGVGEKALELLFNSGNKLSQRGIRYWTIWGIDLFYCLSNMIRLKIISESRWYIVQHYVKLGHKWQQLSMICCHNLKDTLIRCKNSDWSLEEISLVEILVGQNIQIGNRFKELNICRTLYVVQSLFCAYKLVWQTNLFKVVGLCPTI